MPGRKTPDRRSGAQVRVDDLAEDVAELKERLGKIEPFVWVAVYGAAGVGFVVGAFARDAAHIMFGSPL